MTAQGYPDGYDVMWAASDRKGHVGVFFSAGLGPIPGSFLRYEAYDQNDLERYFMDLPDRGESIPIGVVGLYNEERLAKAGCYVFDWSDVHRVSGLLRAYELSTKPSAPLTLSELAPDVRTLIEAVCLLDVDFELSPTLDIGTHTVCLLPTRS